MEYVCKNIYVEQVDQRDTAGEANAWCGKIMHCTQVSSRPPTFVLFTNKNPKTIPTHYVRFLSTLFKEEFGMTGIPIRINIKGRPGKNM